MFDRIFVLPISCALVAVELYVYQAKSNAAVSLSRGSCFEICAHLMPGGRGVDDV